MKKFFKFFFILMTSAVMLTSCMTAVTNSKKPYADEKLELYKKYSVFTEGKKYEMKLTKIDENKIYGKNEKTGEDYAISKSEIKEIHKLNTWATVGISVAAILAIILIPV